MPIPGAAVTIQGGPNDQRIVSWTDVDGSYSSEVPSDGSYTISVQMTAFASQSQQIELDEANRNITATFELVLFSRSRVNSPKTRPNGRADAQRGFQTLSTLQNLMGQDSGGNSATDVVPSGMPVPGIDPNRATESNRRFRQHYRIH